MDEPPFDTPAFESTAATARDGEDGSEALQLGPADAAAVPAPADAAFAMHLGDAKPKPVDKPSKPITAAANASLIAALMGQPIGKKAETQTDALQDAAADSLSRYTGGGPGRGSAETPTSSTLPNAPTPSAVATPVLPAPAVAELPIAPTPSESPSSLASPAAIVLTAADPLPMPVPPPVMPVAAVAAIDNATPPTPPTPMPRSSVVAPRPPVIASTSGRDVGARHASPATDERADAADRADRATHGSPLQQTPALPQKSVKQSPPQKPAQPKASVQPVQPPQPPKPSAAPPRRAIPVAPVWPGHASAVSKPTVSRPVVTQDEPPMPAPVVTPTHAPMPTGAWWTIPLTFVGIAITACAVIIPAADENRRDTYELAKIERDVDYFQRQSAVNTDFLQRIDTDATLTERLALRQLHRTREGAKVIALGGMKPDRFGASPYAITRLDPPADLPAYRPVPGKLTEWFLGDKRPQQMAGLGLCVAGAGVLLGGLRKRRRPASPLHA